MTDDRESILSRAEAEARKILDDAEAEVAKLAPFAADAAADASVVATDASKVDPGLDPVVASLDKDLAVVEADAGKVESKLGAPVVPEPTTTSVGTVTSSTDPTPPPVVSTSENNLDSGLTLSPTTSANVVQTPATAPVSDALPTQVLPTDGAHDTREKQALIGAGVVPGLTDSANSALDELDKTHDAIASWITYAKDQIKKVRAL